jgi:tripartite ATP-independent transporter DctM subunit
MSFATEVGAESGAHMMVPGTHSPEPTTRAGRAIAAVERWTLVAMIGVMAILPTLETAGRKLLGHGFPGQQLIVQHLTLWVTFLGALLATRSQKHLSLATGELIPEGRPREVALFLVNTFSAGLTAFLAYASFELVRADSARPTVIVGPIKEWWSECIMPLALSLIAVRFAWHASPRWPGRCVAFAVLGVALALVWADVRHGERIPDLAWTASEAGGALPADEPAAARLLVRLRLHGETIMWVGIGTILLGMTLGTPVFVAMAGIAMLLFYGHGEAVAAVPTETYQLVQSPTLPVVPLLTAAGYILAEGGASERLVRLARALVGWLPGGMALMVVFVCAGFTTFTGGSGVTILALGGLMYPMLQQDGYPEGFSLGLVTAAGSLGLLFPPSFPVILYAVVANASIKDLYIAGFIPCLILLLLVAAYGIWTGYRCGAPRTPFSAKELLRATWAAKWELAIPTIVIASIFGGFATLVEASAIGVLLAVVSQCAIHKDIHPTKELPMVIEHSSTLVGAVMVLLGVAMGLKSYLVDAEIPAMLLEWTRSHIESPVVFLLVLNGALLVLGSVLEIFSAIAVIAPLLAPIGAAYGVDPLHMGIIFLANLELGFLFPPMGLNLILSSSRFGERLPVLYKVALPFLIIMALGVLLVTYVPATTTGFLSLVRPGAVAGGAAGGG